MNTLIFNGHPLRVTKRAGARWFCAADVVAALHGRNSNGKVNVTTWTRYVRVRDRVLVETDTRPSLFLSPDGLNTALHALTMKGGEATNVAAFKVWLTTLIFNQ